MTRLSTLGISVFGLVVTLFGVREWHSHYHYQHHRLRLFLPSCLLPTTPQQPLQPLQPSLHSLHASSSSSSSSSSSHPSRHHQFRSSDSPIFLPSSPYHYARETSQSWAAPCLVNRSIRLLYNPHTIFLLAPPLTPTSVSPHQHIGDSQKSRFVAINTQAATLASATLKMASFLRPQLYHGNETECTRWAESWVINPSDTKEFSGHNSDDGILGHLVSNLRRLKARWILHRIDKIEQLTDALLSLAGDARIWPSQAIFPAANIQPERRCWWGWPCWINSTKMPSEVWYDQDYSVRSTFVPHDRNTQRRLLAVQQIKDLMKGLRSTWAQAL